MSIPNCSWFGTKELENRSKPPKRYAIWMVQLDMPCLETTCRIWLFSLIAIGKDEWLFYVHESDRIRDETRLKLNGDLRDECNRISALPGTSRSSSVAGQGTALRGRRSFWPTHPSVGCSRRQGEIQHRPKFSTGRRSCAWCSHWPVHTAPGRGWAAKRPLCSPQSRRGP